MLALLADRGVIDIAAAVDANGRLTAWEFDNWNSGAAAIRLPPRKVAIASRRRPSRDMALLVGRKPMAAPRALLPDLAFGGGPMLFGFVAAAFGITDGPLAEAIGKNIISIEGADHGRLYRFNPGQHLPLRPGRLFRAQPALQERVLREPVGVAEREVCAHAAARDRRCDGCRTGPAGGDCRRGT